MHADFSLPVFYGVAWTLFVVAQGLCNLLQLIAADRVPEGISGSTVDTRNQTCDWDMTQLHINKLQLAMAGYEKRTQTNTKPQCSLLYFRLFPEMDSCSVMIIVMMKRSNE